MEGRTDSTDNVHNRDECVPNNAGHFLSAETWSDKSVSSRGLRRYIPYLVAEKEKLPSNFL